MKDADWIRSIAAKPPALRQPIYEGLRLAAIAARLELLEQQNAAFKQVLHMVAVFMQAQADNDVRAMQAAYTELQSAIPAALATEEPERILTEVELDWQPGSRPTVLRTNTEVYQGVPDEPVAPEPPNVVESSLSSNQEE